ncbi:MAG TPA: hypothetical protein VF228_25115 [Iamia sp.]
MTRRNPLVRLALTIVGAAVAGVVVMGLMAATQNRPDPRIAGTSSDVTFDVRVGSRPGGEEIAAHSLWAVCAATLGSVDVGPLEPDEGAWTAHVEPAVGDNAYKRLHGCIEDLTIPRVRGDLHAVTSDS